MTRRAIASYGLAALLGLVIVPGAFAAATPGSQTIVIDLTGSGLSHPCTGESLGTLTSGTLTINDRFESTPTGTFASHRTALWTDVVAVAPDGTTYRVVAVSSDQQVSGVQGLATTFASMWTILG